MTLNRGWCAGLALLLACTAPPERNAQAPAPAAVPTPPAPTTVAATAAPTPEPPRCVAPVVEPIRVAVDDTSVPVPAIVDAPLLAAFYAKVARLLRGDAREPVRIAVYGDSNLTMDFTTGQMRRTLQRRYGDAGHGFVALARPWSHYQHMDVRHGISNGIASYACSTDPLLDGHYGISCLSGESLHRLASAWAGTAKADAPIGQKASRVEVFYLKGRNFGGFNIEVDGVKRMTVDARANAPELGVARVDVEDGPHEFRVVATEAKRRVRWLGAVLERDVPGFVVDSFGVGAMNTPAHARQSPLISVPMLKRRNYDLIIFATGANDVFSLHNTPEKLRQLIAMQREALPNAPILLVTPTDRGKDRSFRQTMDVVKQRYQLAKDNGCALWDQWAAMGGRNSMASFKRRGHARFDYIHITQSGGAYLGDRLLHALWNGLAEHLADNPTAGCDLGS